ncbi:Helitron helicase [Phytophthora megakarya]|uniref:Helitron helicase n=1 Tax=Phytophthora megakarya TaxID=4795 RepID=A0A225W7R0_9STRA|nr:Helitron helicase [Phytophthora megakarya]
MGDKQRQEVQERDTTATRASRRTMTLDERLELREEEWFRNFDPTIILGKDTVVNRHYISRFLRSGEERRCVECGAWKFPGETKKCCCIDGKVKLPPRREAPRKLRLLFNNPVFMKSIRAYNNVSAFTSIGATRSEPLRVDESVTRRGIYNFHIMGTVCHRMGLLLPPPGGKRMLDQIYINDSDSAARVASRIRITGGLSEEFLSDLDEVMEQNQEESGIQREDGGNEEERNQESIENQDGDVHESLIDPEVDCELRLHVGHGTNRGTHNTPTASEVAAIIIDANAAQPRDIVLYTRQGGFNRIYDSNPHYDPLHNPLLHPSESPGGHTNFHARYCVDQWSKAEQQRLQYIENNQREYRLETIQGLIDAYRHEGTEAHRVAAMYELVQTAQDSVTGRERQQNTSNGPNRPGRKRCWTASHFATFI